MNKSSHTRIASSVLVIFVSLFVMSSWVRADVSALTSSLNALENHINGTAPLSGTQIETHKQTIDTNAQYIDDNSTAIAASFNLVSTYETTPGFGPLWVNQPNFQRDSVLDSDIHYAIYCVMQHIMDITYTASNINTFQSLVDGFIFECSSNFPGSVDPPVDPEVVYTVSIDGSQPDTFGRSTMYTELPARKPTGAYAAPGSIVTVTVPASLVNNVYSIRVGGHSHDHSNKSRMERLDRSTVLYPIESTEVKVANPLGGGIYIEVPFLADAGVVEVQIKNAVRSPYFSAKSFHSTTLTEWQTVERNHPAPWADFQSEKFMMTIPTDWIYAFDDPVSLMQDWDQAMDVINDLMGFPHYRGKETMYPIVDVQNKASVFAPGYPSCNFSYNPTTSYGGNYNSYHLTGPVNCPDWIFHEEGHAYGIPARETESTMNLLHVPMAISFGKSLDYAFAASRGFQGNPHRTLDNTAITWMCSFNFAPRENPMASGEKTYQLKGHAKYVDIARLFGWDVLNNYWYSYNEDYENGVSSDTSTNGVILRMSRQAGVDLTPLFHFWGYYPSNADALAAAVAAEGLPRSTAIYDQLVYYRSIVPADNSAFQTFAYNWWDRVPQPDALWTETEHARQYDSNNYWEPYGRSYSGTDPDEADGEIYTEASCARIQFVIDKLLAKYFPDSDVTKPTPNPMAWAELPSSGDYTKTLFSEDFENPVVTGYSQGTCPSEWIKASEGYNSSKHGMINKSSGAYSPPEGNDQGYAFRYTNTGMTSADGMIGRLALNEVYTISFDVVMDEGLNDGLYYKAQFIAFGDDIFRTDVRSIPLNSELLAQTTGNATDDSLFKTVSFQFAADPVTHAASIGKDLGVRFVGATTSAIIDNVSVTVSTPSPTDITMEATTAIDASPVEYYFTCTAGGGHDSGWQGSPRYTDVGLTQGVEYTYTVKVRDLSTAMNMTDESEPASMVSGGFPCGDLNESGGAVDLADFALMAGCWGLDPFVDTECAFANLVEFDDQVIDGLDLAAFAEVYLSTPTAFPPNCSFSITDPYPPTPDPMAFAVVPYVTSDTSIAMTAETASDSSGVEYYFTCTAGGGHDSGWQDNETYEDTGLTPGTLYTYTVMARDKSANLNTTSPSDPASTIANNWVEVLYEDFESGLVNWDASGVDSFLYTEGIYAYQGNNAVNIQDNNDNSVTSTADLALSGYSEIKVEFAYYCTGMTYDTEDFWLQLSTDGGVSYTTVEEWNLFDEFVLDKFYTESVTITGHTLTDQTRLRFRCDATGNGDDVYIDVISISVK